MNKQGSKNIPRFYVACYGSTEQKWRTSKKGKYCYHILADIFLQETFPSVAQDQNIFHYPLPAQAGGGWLVDAELHDDTLQPR